jgi:hypothetical protein
MTINNYHYALSCSVLNFLIQIDVSHHFFFSRQFGREKRATSAKTMCLDLYENFAKYTTIVFIFTIKINPDFEDRKTI